MAIRLKDADSSLGRLVSVLAGAGADLAGLHSQTQAYVGVLDSRFQNLAAALAGVHAESSNYTGTMWGDLLGLTASLYGNLGSIGAEYTLANALAGVPFAVSTPIPPTITSEATVTPATLAANLVNGRRVTLSAGAGTYSGFTINTTDQEFILLSGVTVTGEILLGSNARRIIVRGNPLRANSVGRFSPPLAANSITDILFNGLTVPGSSTTFWGNISRSAVINCSIRCLSDSALYGGTGCNNFIMANNSLRSEGTGQTGFRMMGANRFVFVDNLMRKINSGHNTFRLHWTPGVTTGFHCVRRNQFEGSRIRINPIGDNTTWEPGARLIEDVWFEDNDFYWTIATINAFMEINHPNDVRRLTYRNNRNYGSPSLIFRHDDPTPRFSDGTAIATWDVSGNSIQPLPGTIPTWSFS